MKKNNKNGQTLIALLIFMIMAITISSAAVMVLINNALNVERLADGFATKDIAENGIENALLRLLRNPSYTGEVLTQGTGTVTISVTGVNPQTIRSLAVMGNFVRIMEAQVSYTNNILTVDSWKEVYN